MANKAHIYFEVKCKLGKYVRITEERWFKVITNKHPEMSGREDNVRKVLEDPDEIRSDPKDAKVYRYHRKFDGHYIRVVAKHLNDEAFLITAFPETKIGGGELIWQK